MLQGVRAVAGAVAMATAIAAATSGASGATTPPAKQVAALVGTWTCVTQTSNHRTYREKDVYAMFGPWVRDVGTYPAAYGQPAGTLVGYVGYDAKHRRWISTSVDTGSGYALYYSTSPSLDGSRWSDGYPRGSGGAVFRLHGTTQYTLDASGTSHGKAFTSHQVCTRS